MIINIDSNTETDKCIGMQQNFFMLDDGYYELHYTYLSIIHYYSDR